MIDPSLTLLVNLNLLSSVRKTLPQISMTIPDDYTAPAVTYPNSKNQ